MKIGMVSQWYEPETGPASLPATYAREMTAQGHSVRVLTGYPNYPEGRLYPGYQQRGRTVETRDGISVVRVPLYTEHSASAVGRALNYTSFAASASTFGARALHGADAIWVYNSPVTVTAPLMLESRFGKIPYFLHVMDLWPDSLIHSGMISRGLVSRVAVEAARKVVRMAERRAHVIGVISPTARDLILERDPSIDPSRVVFVPNPADESLYRPVTETRAILGVRPDPEKFTVMYAGAIGEVQGLDTLLDAASQLRDEPRVQFRLYGDGIARARLSQRQEEESLSNVRFLGRVPQGDIPRLIAEADAQLVSLAESEFLRFTMPSKISTLLCSGTPIIAHISGDGADLLNSSRAAKIVQPGDANGLVNAILSLVYASESELASIGRSGRDFYLQELSVSQVTQKIVTSMQT